MKHYHLKKAIEKAKSAGMRVLRTFIPGVGLYVRVTNDKGDYVGKIYTAGNANGQARFIDVSIGKLKGFRLVEAGRLYLFREVTIFKSSTYGTVYAWNKADKEWQLMSDQQSINYIGWNAKASFNVKVDCRILCSGVIHPDW